MAIPPPPDGVRNSKLQACPSGTMLFLGRTDGVVLKIPIPEMAKADLTLLTIRRAASTSAGDSAAAGAGGASGLLCASCGTPNQVFSISAADGASSGYGHKLHHAWSQIRGMLAIVNARNEAIVMQKGEDGSSVQLLREQLPEATIVSISWDPSTQSVLAIAIRHYGIALWDTKADAGVQMWSGMSYKHSIIPLRKSMRSFDPVFAQWNLAGQLEVGMQDGTFAVWDSMSMDISTSQSSGKHKGPITAGDWFSSLFAPALALASRSTIKVSQGFEGVEWSATAMKLKVGKDKSTFSSPTSFKGRALSLSSRSTKQDSVRERGDSVSDPGQLEGLEFEKIRFSPSGRHIGAITCTALSGVRQASIYELQDNRNAMVQTRDLTFENGDAPFGLQWLIDNTLLVFCKSSVGMLTIRTVAPSPTLPSTTWPTIGTNLPGTVVDCQASTQGLIAIALATPNEKGVLMIVTCPAMTVVAEMPLDGKPQSIQLYQPKGSYIAYLSIAFEGGGVEAYELPPADSTVDIS